jgi:hypothetical protein
MSPNLLKVGHTFHLWKDAIVDTVNFSSSQGSLSP